MIWREGAAQGTESRMRIHVGLVPNVLRTEQWTRGITRGHVPSRPPCQPVSSSGLPPALCPFPKGCSGGHTTEARGRAFKHRRLCFQKQTCLLSEEAPTESEATKRLFLQTGPWPLPLTRIPAFPAGFFLLKAKSNWAGRELPSWPCKPSGWEQIRYCGTQVWGPTKNAAFAPKPLMVLSVIFGKSGGQVKIWHDSPEAAIRGLSAAKQFLLHYRANLSSSIGTDSRPRLVKEQDYSGVLFFHDALYLYSKPDPLRKLIFRECHLVWFWSFSSWWHLHCQSWCSDYHSHAQDARHCQRELSSLQRPEAYAKLNNWKLSAVSKGCFCLLYEF